MAEVAVCGSVRGWLGRRHFSQIRPSSAMIFFVFLCRRVRLIPAAGGVWWFFGFCFCFRQMVHSG